MGFAVCSLVPIVALSTIVPQQIDGIKFQPIVSKTSNLKPSALCLPSLMKISKHSSNIGEKIYLNRFSRLSLKSEKLCSKSNSIMSSIQGLPCFTLSSRARMKHENCKAFMIRNNHPNDDPHGDFSYKRSSAPNHGHCSQDPVDQSGYEIRVSTETMGVFQYVEKVKRVRLRELSATLRQVSRACLVFSFIKGFVTPLVEVFKSDPPNWGKLILFLGAFDAFAISYMAIKAKDPLDKLSALATELSSEDQIMGSIEKEEELMLALVMELLGLFGRLHYLTFVTGVAQLAHIVHALLQMRGIQTNLPEYMANFVASWLGTPWA